MMHPRGVGLRAFPNFFLAFALVLIISVSVDSKVADRAYCWGAYM